MTQLEVGGYISGVYNSKFELQLRFLTVLGVRVRFLSF